MDKFDIESTLYLKYQNKPRINAILKTINWIDPNNDMKRLIDYVLNFQSLKIGSFGLNLYGILLNFNRAFANIKEDFFGFQDTNLKPFNSAPFFIGIFEYSENIVMSNTYYKMLLSGLFLSSFFDGSLYNLNVIVQTIFKYTIDGLERKLAVVRNGINSISVISTIELEDWEKNFFNKNIIPIPIGISYSFKVQNLLKKRNRTKNETERQTSL